jgi:hypothetical protein
MITQKTWKEFRETGLLWFINRTLHLFGWAIVYEFEEDNTTIKAVYPARCKFRGFDEQSETIGFQQVTNYIQKTILDLQKELEA